MLHAFRMVYDLFDARERWRLLMLLLLVVLMALVQTVGVASILPFMSLVSNPALIEENRWLAWMYSTSGLGDTRSFLILVGVLTLMITAFSNVLAATTNWLMLRFTWNKQHRLAVHLLSRYLHEPYEFHLDRNSGDLAKNILVEVREAINGVVLPGMKMIAQGMVGLSIFALLLVVDATIAVTSVVVLGGAYTAVYLRVKRKQRGLGRSRNASNRKRFEAASEALGGIKEARVLGCERVFLHRFSDAAREYSSANISNAVLVQIPRYALETVAFGGLIVIVLYMLSTRDTVGQAIAIISLYALAGYRLMPALQRVFNGFAKTRFFAPGLEALHSDLMRGGGTVRRDDHAESEHAVMPFSSSIAFDGVWYRYPNSSTHVLRDISLSVSRHTTVGLVGSTGSGKTTLVDIVLGLLQPERGRVCVDGVPLDASNMESWRRIIGYVPQHIYLSDDTVAANIAFGVPTDQVDAAAVERAARVAHLHEFVEALPQQYATVVGERGIRLSGGQRQRIGIARALYRNPEVLVMDEATSALDGITEDRVMEAIRALAGEKTIILVAHRITTLRDCDAIHFFHEGAIKDSGTYDELIARNREFRAMAKLPDPEPAPIA